MQYCTNINWYNIDTNNQEGIRIVLLGDDEEWQRIRLENKLFKANTASKILK